MPGQTSHHLRVDRDTVSKSLRFRSRGEPDREWDGLTLLAEEATKAVDASRACRADQSAHVLRLLDEPGPSC